MSLFEPPSPIKPPGPTVDQAATIKPGRGSVAGPLLLATLGYVVIVVLICSGVVVDLNHRILFFFVDNLDMVQCIWHCWYTDWALAHHLPLFNSPLINYPYGSVIMTQVGNNYDQLLSVPFQRLFGFPAYYNLMVMLQMLLNALAGFLLVRHLARDNYCAFFGGAVFAFNPYYFHEITVARHPPTHMYWVPLFLLFFLKSQEEKNWYNPVLAGLLLALTCWSYWFYGYFLVIIMLILLAGDVLMLRNLPRKEGWKSIRGALLRILVMVAAFSLAVAPFASFFLGRAFHNTLAGSVALRPLGWAALPQLSDSLTPQSLLGVAPLLLLLALVPWIFMPRKTPWAWICALVAFGILSLGPVLRSANEIPGAGSGGIALPFQWLAAVIPFYNRLSWPSRHLCVYFLCLAVLGGLALAGMRRSPSGGIRALALILLVGGIAAASWIWPGSGYPAVSLPLRTTPLGYIPPFYLAQAAQSGNHALIELPLEVDLSAMYYQIYHHRPIYQGFRRESRDNTLSHDLATNSFLRYLDAISRGQEVKPFFSSLQKDELFRLGFRYLIVRKESFARLSPTPGGVSPPGSNGEARYQRLIVLLETVLGKPFHQDQAMTVFALTPEALATPTKEPPTGNH